MLLESNKIFKLDEKNVLIFTYQIKHFEKNIIEYNNEVDFSKQTSETLFLKLNDDQKFILEKILKKCFLQTVQEIQVKHFCMKQLFIIFFVK